MGCTSSAPNVSEVHANSTDKTIKFSEDDVKNEIKVGNEVTGKKTENVLKIQNALPDNCDITIHGTQLDRNNSFVFNDSSNLEILKDNEGKVIHTIGQNYENLPSQENISTLKEFVEQVISKNILQKQQSIGASSDSHHSTDQETDNAPMQSKELSLQGTSQKELIREELINQEITSPSQSECSRATRWEALADMAAELPPSLTVDPITGHIYALSK